MQYTAIPTNLDSFDDPEDDAHTARDVTAQLQSLLAQEHAACRSILSRLTPLRVWIMLDDRTSVEHFCLETAEQACAQLARTVSTEEPDAGINGVMFDRWDTHCWALHGLQGIHSGNRTQVGGVVQHRLEGIRSPVERAAIADSRFRTAQFTQFGTHCVGGWYGTCVSCYTDLTFVIDQPALAGGEDCPWPPGLTKPWSCAHDCDGYWSETERLSCPAHATGKHAAVRKTYVLTKEACCTESFCGRPMGTEFLGQQDPIAYSTEMMGSRDITNASCAAAGDAFFQGKCGTRSSDWVDAHHGDADPTVNCPRDGAVVESDCMLCPGSTPVPCLTCGGNSNPADDIVRDNGTGCEDYFTFPTVALPDPHSRDATGVCACDSLDS